MADEWFDVVDETDRVIGRDKRSEVHRRGLRHRAVHVLIFDRAGRVFLQKRSPTKDTAPGTWDSSASGHVDAGEAYDACARRELQEELGWQPVAAPEALFKLEAASATGNEFVWVYRTRWDGQPFALNDTEIETGAWFTVTEVAVKIATRPHELAPSFRSIWIEVRERGLLE